MIAQEIVGSVSGCSDVPTLLIYDEEDPFSIQFIFATGEQTVEWEVARELLRDALLNGIAGVGDVRFWLDDRGTTMAMLLHDTRGNSDTTITYPAAELQVFIDNTATTVPFGEEVVDVEAEIREWMDERPTC